MTETTNEAKKTWLTGQRKKRIKEYVFCMSLWILPIITWFILTVGSVGGTITLAFQKYDPKINQYYWVGFETFEEVFIDIVSNPVFVISIQNSIIIWLTNTVFSLPIDLLVSYSVYKKIYGAEFFRVILFLPSVVSGMVWTLVYQYIVEFGIPWILNDVNAISYLYDPTKDFWILLFFMLWQGFAGGLVLYTGAMSRIPYTLVESAKLDGLSYLKEWYYITIPLIFPTISVTLITLFTGMFLSGLPIYNFYAGSARAGLYSIHYYLYNMVVGNINNPVKFPFSAALNLIISAVTVPLTLLMRHLVEKYGPTVEY